jgi:hypothetical protein
MVYYTITILFINKTFSVVGTGGGGDVSKKMDI